MRWEFVITGRKGTQREKDRFCLCDRHVVMFMIHRSACYVNQCFTKNVDVCWMTMRRFYLPRRITERSQPGGADTSGPPSHRIRQSFCDQGRERVSLARARCEFSRLYAGGPWKRGSGKWSFAWPPNLDPLQRSHCDSLRRRELRISLDVSYYPRSRVLIFLQKTTELPHFFCLALRCLFFVRVFVSFAVQHSLSCLAERLAPNLRRERSGG